MSKPQTDVATFYAFFPLGDYRERREPLRAMMKERGVKGTVLLAPEGINATLAGAREDVENIIEHMVTLPGIPPLDIKWTLHDAPPFGRSVVKCKQEIIRFDYPLPPDTPRGRHVSAAEWNKLVDDKNVTVLDTRNSYEVHVGSFARARNPQIRHFTQLKDYVERELDPAEHPQIATFCTGGVRCEKFTAWLLEKGFRNVYQLEGGILRYLEDTPASDSRWQGECYVFDERVAVSHALAKSPEITMCPACGHALTPDDRAHEAYIPESACPYCG